MDIGAFRKALPLMGENIAPDKIEKLFAEADADGSGENRILIHVGVHVGVI